MARPSNTDERRAQIVAGLRQVMAQSGYDGASTAAIAEAAGLASGLVHYHFKSKEEILVALAEDLGVRLRRRYEQRTAGAGTAWERLLAFLDAHVALGDDADPEALACWLMLGTEALRKPEVRRVVEGAYRERMAELSQLVGALLKKPSAQASRGIAAALLAAIEGAYQLAALGGVAPKGFAAPMLHSLARALLVEHGAVGLPPQSSSRRARP